MRDDVAAVARLRRNGVVLGRVARHRRLPFGDGRSTAHDRRIHLGQPSPVRASDRNLAVHLVCVGDHDARRNGRTVPVRGAVLRVGAVLLRHRSHPHRAADHSVDLPAQTRQHQQC